MSTLPGKEVLITGANAGIGKDVARQLALRPEMARIYLACRNRDRATTAKAELEAKTGRRIFDIVVMDVADPDVGIPLTLTVTRRSLRRPAATQVIRGLQSDVERRSVSCSQRRFFRAERAGASG